MSDARSNAPFRQRGFTLIEVIVAASLSVFITLAATAVLVQAVAVSDLVTSKVRINQEARLLLDLLLDGAAVNRNGNTTIDAGETIPGYHGGMIPLTTPGAGVTDHLCPMASVFGTSVVVTDHRLTLPDVYPTIAADLTDRVGLSSSVLGVARNVACFAEDATTETVGPWAVATTAETLETLGRQGASCPATSSTPLVNGLVSVYQPTAADSGLAAPANADTADDFFHLRLDIVDFSLLAPAGADREYTRGEHTESFMVQVRCQREFYGS